MTLWPFESKVEWEGFDGPSVYIASICANPFCANSVVDIHHIARRSGLAGDFQWVRNKLTGKSVPNVVGLCRPCHENVTQNRIHIMFRDGVFYWGKNEVPLKPQPGMVSSESKSEIVPGQTCPTCGTRKKHARRASSPSTKQIRYHCPQDDWKAHKEIVGVAAAVLELNDKPHWMWATVTAMCAIILQMTPKEISSIYQRKNSLEREKENIEYKGKNHCYYGEDKCYYCLKESNNLIHSINPEGKRYSVCMNCFW